MAMKLLGQKHRKFHTEATTTIESDINLNNNKNKK